MIIKKVILLFSFIMIMLSSGAQQVLFSEDFTTWPPPNWTIFSGAGSDASGDGLWHSYYNSGAYLRYVNSTMMHNEWMITPLITVPTTSTDFIKLNWSWTAEYFTYFVGNSSYDPDLKVKISIDSGATWQMIWVEDDSTMVANSGITDWPWIDEKDYTSELDITQYAGNNIKIAYQLKGQYPMLYFQIGDVKVIQQSPLDLELSKLKTKPYYLPGDVDIIGRIKNVGVQPINSFDVTYNINGGAESIVYSVTGLNLLNEEEYVFTHDTPYNFTADGTYVINVTISNVNGGGETIISNNTLSKNVIIDHTFIPLRTLFEEFTGSTCSACVIVATNTLNGFFANQVSPEDYTLIKYQMNFPGAGDPYYTAGCGVRASLYGVYGIPHFVMDGTHVPHASVMTQGEDVLYEYYEDNKIYNAAMKIDATHILNQTTKDIVVTVKINSKESFAGVKLFVAIVEKMTTGNVGSNGETEFYQVFMKMLPNANGKVISVTENQEATFVISGNLNGTFIEEMSDLEVVVFVQKTDKTILQSTIAGLPASINDIDSKMISIFPNPINDVVTIENAKNSNIIILDLQARTLINKNITSNSQQIDVSSLSRGIYLIQITHNKSVITKKVIIN